MQQGFQFSTAGRIVSGLSSADALAEIVEIRSAKQILVLSDSNIARTGLLDAPLTRIRRLDVETTMFTEIMPEPPAYHVDELQARFQGKSFDLLVAIGGGSVIDVAKLLSVLINAPFKVSEIVGTNKVPGPGIPLVAIPTTAGTGSEVTPNAIVTLTDEHLKVGIVSPYLLPSEVVLDPTLTVGMPPLVTASTGVDAFIHSLESVTSNKENPMCNAVGYHSMKLIFPALPKAYEHPDDLGARNDMLLGSMLGGMALTAAGTTAVHALSYPLGGKFGIPHGVANAMLLVPVMEYNIDTLRDDFAEIALVVGICSRDLPIRERSDRFLDSLKTLVREVNIPTDFANYGVTENDLEELTVAASKVTRLLDNNRRKLALSDIRAIYENAFQAQ